jgi:hypothetical protein
MESEGGFGRNPSTGCPNAARAPVTAAMAAEALTKSRRFVGIPYRGGRQLTLPCRARLCQSNQARTAGTAGTAVTDGTDGAPRITEALTRRASRENTIGARPRFSVVWGYPTKTKRLDLMDARARDGSIVRASVNLGAPSVPSVTGCSQCLSLQSLRGRPRAGLTIPKPSRACKCRIVDALSHSETRSTLSVPIQWLSYGNSYRRD